MTSPTNCPTHLQHPGIPAHIFISRMVCVAILVGSALTYWVSDWFHLFFVFIALNYFQSTLQWGICPPTILLGFVGWTADDDEEPIVLKQRVYPLGRNKPSTSSTANEEATLASCEETHGEETSKVAKD